MALDLGLNAVQFVTQTPDSPAVFLVTAIGDQYLVIGGEGNRAKIAACFCAVKNKFPTS